MSILRDYDNEPTSPFDPESYPPLEDPNPQPPIKYTSPTVNYTNPDPPQKYTGSISDPPAAGAPAPGYDYGKFLDSWWHAAPGTDLNKFISDHPDFTQGASTSNNGEWLNLPGGESFDAVRDKGGDNAPMWGSYDYDYATGRKLSADEAAAQESAWARSHPSGGSGGSGGGAGGGGDYGLPSWMNQFIGSSTSSGANPNWTDAYYHNNAQREVDSLDNPMSSAQFEALRQPIDAARRTSMNSAAGELAARGTLNGSGELANYSDRLESHLAPQFATAVENASVANQQNSQRNLIDTLNGASQNTQMQADIALRNLDQNRQWEQFVASYGLSAAQLQYMMQHGDSQLVIDMINAFNNSSQISANGYIK